MSLLSATDDLQQSLAGLSSTKLTVAFSGGLDSTVLLVTLQAVMKDMPQHTLQAVHVHHGLSPNADRWTMHCERVCADLNVPLYVERVTVKQQPRVSLEAAARAARYAALYHHAEAGVLLTGQHLDDQLETLLLQLKRGAGPAGLAGMAAKQQASADLVLWRPFLTVGREELEAFARKQGLTWIEDESNQDVRFDRNFLRHEVLPALHARWPGFAVAASRSARMCAQQQALLEEISAEKLQTLSGAKGTLHVEGLRELSVPWQHQVVRLWLKRQGALMPSEAQLHQLEALVNAREDAQPELKWGAWQVRRYQGALYLLNDGNVGTPDEIEWTVHSPLILAHLNAELHYNGPLPRQRLHIRFGNFSARFTPQGRSHSKPLKQWFKEWKVPPWERERVAQIYLGDRLLALATATGLICGSEQESASLLFDVK